MGEREVQIHQSTAREASWIMVDLDEINVLRAELVKCMKVLHDSDMFYLHVCRWCGCWLYCLSSDEPYEEKHRPDCFAVKYLDRPSR